MKNNDMERKNLIAQWAFDTRPILLRFHLWLEDVQIKWFRGNEKLELHDSISFVDSSIEKQLIMTAAVTALGTKLFGRYSEGINVGKKELNQIKKDADAVSAYAMSESLWYLSRLLPENHAIMVCLGEGLMPKVGETTEMGANPLLGFGRIYARPQVAQFLEECVRKLINDAEYGWDEYRHEIYHAGITVWGAAIDTLENTSRFAKGASTGPMTVLHLFNQPLAITNQYEGYIGNLLLPKEIVENAAKESILIDFFTPRSKIVSVIKKTYPAIENKNIHVWTLRGEGRRPRIGALWDQWLELGVNLIDDDWQMSKQFKPFTESGTYAPTLKIGTWEDEDGKLNLFIVDGYAASAEAIQAASLAPILNLHASLSVFSSKFELRYDREPMIMKLNPDNPEFGAQLSEIFERTMSEKEIERYHDDILLAKSAGIPVDKRTICLDDIISEKKWDVMAISGYMLPDPYSEAPGVEKVGPNTYAVSVRLSTQNGDKQVTFKLRLLETFEESRLVFQPLLNRFMRGENYKNRPVRISDSGRIRNELQTLCSTALEHLSERRVVVHFDKILDDIIPEDDKRKLRKILEWYKTNHSLWFKWLDIK